MGNNHSGRNSNVVQCRSSDDVLFISGVLNFDSVLSLDEEVRAWISGHSATALAINLEGISYANSAAIALALGWLRLVRDAGKTLAWQQVPGDMLAMARVGGVEALFHAE
ncbi:MAG: STAS domain-containing protein [Alcanivoracaceae bacterium]|nr:STAS domain-containing protein [Alcanivoracaceae bacterium]